jgi:hypothetical protein
MKERFKGMKEFLDFCEANGLDPLAKASKKAFVDSGKDPESEKRSYKPQTVTLWAHGTTADGEILFREATGIATRSREHATSVLRYQMETEDGCETVRVGVVKEEL